MISYVEYIHIYAIAICMDICYKYMLYIYIYIYIIDMHIDICYRYIL